MRSTNELLVTFLSIVWLASDLAVQELISVSNKKTVITDDVVYLYWKINPRLEITSDGIRFRVFYCPIDQYHDPQNCKVNITICEANYTILPLSGTTVTYEDNLNKYLNSNGNIDVLLTKNTSALLSSAWNSISRQFMCAIHHLKDCIRDDGRKWGGFLISDGANYTEEQDIRLLKAKQLKRPEDIRIIENGSKVTVKWHSFYKCPIDVPDFYLVLLKPYKDDSTIGKFLQEKKLSVIEKSTKDWECTFSASSLRPHTVYSVHVSAGVFRGWKQGPVAETAFRSKDGAPAKPPSILCSQCIQSTFFQDYRNVTVRWKLPPKNLWNGVIRKVVLQFWTKDQRNTTENTIVVHDNLTFAVLPRLQPSVEYVFQVKICTSPNLCSDYSGMGYILKKRKAAKFTDRSNTWIIGLSVGLPLSIITVVLAFCFLWRRRESLCKCKERPAIEKHQLSEDNLLNNRINPSKSILSVESGEYHTFCPSDEIDQNASEPRVTPDTLGSCRLNETVKSVHTDLAQD